jgi:ribosomal protein S18 acetylase RimI-like enzyme
VGVPTNTEPERVLGTATLPFGEIDLDPGGVDVDANKDETDAFDLYGKLYMDEAGDWYSSGVLGFDILRGDVPSARAGDGWEGAALFIGVMKSARQQGFEEMST